MNDQAMSIASQLVPVAKVVAITASGAATGAIFVISMVGIPTILMAPDNLLAKQWQATYKLGAATMPPLALSCSACFAFLASQSTKLPGLFPHLAFDPTAPWALYTAAAVSIPAIVPYTLGVLKPTNDKLHKKANEPDSISDSETRVLIQQWKGMNYNRAIFALTGTLLGAIAMCMA